MAADADPVSGLRFPAVRQQLVDAVVRMRQQPLEHVLEVGERVEVIEAGALDQRDLRAQDRRHPVLTGGPHHRQRGRDHRRSLLSDADASACGGRVGGEYGGRG